MRTTLNIDDDLLQIAREMATRRGVSLSRHVNDLLRRGLEVAIVKRGDGLPSFDVPPGTRPITLEDVKRIQEEMDDEEAEFAWTGRRRGEPDGSLMR